MMKSESLLDHPTISARMFYPWPNRFQDPLYIEGHDGRLGCRYGGNTPERPTIIHFHGNGETVGEYLEGFIDGIEALGANLLLAEYRGYGMSDGKPKLADMLKDIPPIVEASGAASPRLVFFGRSLGSLYAAHAASLYPDAAGLILESGIAEPFELISARVEPWQVNASEGDLRREVERIFNQEEKLRNFRGRTLVMHTLTDDIVPVSHGRQLYEWAGGQKELVILERGGHNNIREVNEKRYFDHLAEFIRKCAKS